MSDYTQDVLDASEAIAEDGKAATLIRHTTSGPAYNPIITETTYSVMMVETGYSITNRQDTLIQAGDKVGIISAAGEAPLLSDKIQIGGDVYSFVDVKPLAPGDLSILFEFHCRR